MCLNYVLWRLQKQQKEEKKQRRQHMFEIRFMEDAETAEGIKKGNRQNMSQIHYREDVETVEENKKTDSISLKYTPWRMQKQERKGKQKIKYLK